MGVARSSYHAKPEGRPEDAAIVAEIRAIADEFEGYGYRRVGAELRHRGFVVNAKRVRRLMKAHALNPRRRRRFTKTTDSDHDGPIFPLIAKEFEVHGPDQLWVADLTYIAIAAGFAYVALILDAWSRRVIGYAIGRRIDARLAVEALRRAIALRKPLPGCVFHTDRGSQYASEKHRDLLAEHGLIGSMSRRGNPYDNPQAESFMKTLKVEDAYLMEYETFEEVAAGVPRFIKVYNRRRLHSALGCVSPIDFKDRNPRAPVKTAA
jgi:putative transposase